MRAAIDGVFNVPICDKVFDGINVFALTSNGIPVWANLFLSIIDVCDTDQEALRGKSKATINKYVKKYHK